jgi:hypothetical protein
MLNKIVDYIIEKFDLPIEFSWDSEEFEIWYTKRISHIEDWFFYEHIFYIGNLRMVVLGKDYDRNKTLKW